MVHSPESSLPQGRPIFDPKGIIRTNLLEVFKVILPIKYQGYRPGGFRQEDCFMFTLYMPLFTLYMPIFGPRDII